MTGPVAVFCGVGGNFAPLFLGHGEQAPEISIRETFKPIKCDLTGETHSLDDLYDGEEATVSCSLVRYNEVVLTAIQTYASTLYGPRGIDLPGAQGALMLQEGIAYQLWLVFPYAAKAAFNNGISGPMPPGYHFYAAHLEGPDGIQGGSASAKKIRLTWKCIRTVVPATVNGINTAIVSLYDTLLASFAGLPAIN